MTASQATTLGVDVGGTFTDAVLVVPATNGDGASEVFTGKTPTTPADQSLGVIVAAEAALTAASLEPASVGSFVHGMTVTTNAMLEHDFARTALLATAGFTDIEELARQNRPRLYHLCEPRTEPIVPRELRYAVAERCTPSGVLRPLDEDSVLRAASALAEQQVEAVAVCLLFSFLHPAHELRVGELLTEHLPGVHVTLSHRAVGTFREYERCSTTVTAAALAPRLGSYMSRLAGRAAAAGLPEPRVMLSNGGTCPASEAVMHAAHTVLSGPSGGAVGVAAHSVAGAPADGRLVGFDMGGTSTDVSVVEDDAIRITALRDVAGRPVALPAVDVFTVGAGGGSIGWRDGGGALRVGPRSAGARPGPAAYGKGGTEPTVTDAHLLLGHLDGKAGLAGGLRLDRAAAERAIAQLAGELGIDTTTTAAGIIEIANVEMLRATSAMTVARGIDPRGYTLVAFGGAGPMHATAIADRLGIRRVLCPRVCGVFSALGLALAGRRNDVSRSYVCAVGELGEGELSRIAGELTGPAAEALSGEPGVTTAVVCAMRYVGQSFELDVEATGVRNPAELAGRFHTAHEREFGFSDGSAAVELVTVRASASTPRAPLPERAPLAQAERQRSVRNAWFDGAWHETTVLHGDGAIDTPVAGPLIAELPQATVVVPPGWLVATDATSGALLLTTRESIGAS